MEGVFIYRLLCIALYRCPQNKIFIGILKYRVDLLVNFHGRLLLEVLSVSCQVVVATMFSFVIPNESQFYKKVWK